MAIKQIEFRLQGRVSTSLSWELPLKTCFLRKKNENGVLSAPKKIHYIPGAESAFVEDYDGDEKPQKVYFEEGKIKVPEYNTVLLYILYNHPYFNVHYKRHDEEIQNSAKLEKFDLVEKALEKIKIANLEELKACGIVLIGASVVHWSDNKVKAELKQMAWDRPQDVLEKMNGSDYESRWIGALAIIRGVLLVNASKTAVTWPNGKIIVRVATGQDEIDKLGHFLSENTEESKITLQEIGTKMKRSYVRKQDVTETDTFKKATGEGADYEPSEEVEEFKLGIKEARTNYYKKFNKEVPPNMKNNLEWIKKKLDEA